MAKKVFYNRHRKLPNWAQLYVVAGILTIIVAIFIFFLGIEHVSEFSIADVQIRPFASKLFYHLKESDSDDSNAIIHTYIERLTRTGALRVTESGDSACRQINLLFAEKADHAVVARYDKKNTATVFHALSFAESVPKGVSLNVHLLNGSDECAVNLLYTPSRSAVQLVSMKSTLLDHQPFFLKDLSYKHNFSQVYSEESSFKQNFQTLISDYFNGYLFLPVKPEYANKPAVMWSENPLRQHPVFEQTEKSPFRSQSLYLAQKYQLGHRAGIAVTLVCLVFALVPFLNAFGVYRERFDFFQAFSSLVIYAMSFGIFFALLSFLIHITTSPSTILGGAALLIFTLMLATRRIQTRFFRFELNRVGIHFILLILLALIAVKSLLLSWFVAAILLTASAFYLSSPFAKIVRLIFLGVIIGFFLLGATAASGNLHSFLIQWLPRFSFAQLPSIILTALIGGGICSLFMVRRERY